MARLKFVLLTTSPVVIKNLVKNGHTNVELVELPEAMTKEAGLAYAKANNLFAIPADTDVTAEDLVAVAGK
jgi:hypothetical protein